MVDAVAPATRGYVFVLSHMRSYSTLLCHILNNHPEVDGYAELHIPYRSPDDLAVLEREMAATLDTRPAGRLALDKILHDEYETDPSVLGRDDVSLVVTIREPERTLPSIMTLGRNTEPPDWKADPDRATEYYCRRLERLAAIVTRHPGKALFFDSEDVVRQTATVLDALRAHLHLSSRLEPAYAPHRYTGQDGYGDWSEFIGAGEILPSRREYADVDVRPPLMAEAWRAYDRCRETLLAQCATGAVGRR